LLALRVGNFAPSGTAHIKYVLQAPLCCFQSKLAQETNMAKWRAPK